MGFLLSQLFRYQEEQSDVDGNLRKVWIFPLRKADTSEAKPLPEAVILKKQEAKEKEAAGLTDAELEKRARHSKKRVGTRQVTTSTFERNVYVAELAKRKADGICQLCNSPAPFKDKKGNLFLEALHIVWFSCSCPAGDDPFGVQISLSGRAMLNVLLLAGD